MQQLHTNIKMNVYWALSDSWILTIRSTKHFFRSIEQLASATIMPIVLLLLFRYVLGGAINIEPDVEYVNYLVAGILVQTLAFGASTTSCNLALDLHRGIIERFKSLPMFSPALLIGHVTADLIRNVMSSAVMLGISFFVGFRPKATPIEWLYVLGMLLLFTFAFSWLSAIIGLLVKDLEATQWFCFIIVMPLTFVSSGFVPTQNMPQPLRIFAENQPVTHIIDAIRSWFIGTPAGDTVWIAIACCFVTIIVSIPIATFLFRRYKL